VEQAVYLPMILPDTLFQFRPGRLARKTTWWTESWPAACCWAVPAVYWVAVDW